MPLTVCHPCMSADQLGKHVAHVCTDKACACTSCLEEKLRRRVEQRRAATQRREASQVAAGGIRR